jgi:HEPN domain-containing protein
MPPDRDIPGSPQAWLERAKGHLALAKQPKPEGAFWEDYCFLLQQAAEKALKAVHQHLGLVFRYTHDLEELGTRLENSGVSIPSVVREAVILTRYAFETRYPGLFEPVTDDEYREAVRLAEAVVTWADSVMTGRLYNDSDTGQHIFGQS